MDNRDKLREMFAEKHSAYKEFFDTNSGQIILKDLEEEYRINRSTITDMKNIDPVEIACREAQRAVILRIKNLASGEQLKRFEPQANKPSNT